MSPKSVRLRSQGVPRLSIGLPVYNGENYLAPAVDSILAQTFTDFELIVSDNASTDATEAICRAYARQDRRIRYVRNDRNVGASANYNRTFALSQETEYFKWAAHDDEIAPTYLEKCIAALEDAPDAVLCQSLVEIIDQTGTLLRVYDSGLNETRTGRRPSERFKPCVLREHKNTEVFGVLRRRAFSRTILHGDYHGCDLVLLAEMALQGRFLQVPEPLFRNREHPARYTRATKRWEKTTWHASGTQGRLERLRRSWPAVFFGFADVVRRQVADPAERFRCYAALIRWWCVNANAYRAVIDITCAISPRTYLALDRLKAHVLGEDNPANGPSASTNRGIP
jgi:glycosyltransferase involved in cell wall biosynthesis